MSFYQTIVNSEWLLENLNHPDIAIIDCRFALTSPSEGKQAYQNGHIPNALYFDLNEDLSSPPQKHGGRHPLPNLEKLAEKLANSGIEWQKTQVIAYDDSRFAFASRLWWLLRYLGHNPVALLDGGFSNWQAKGYPVTQEVITPKPAQFLSQPHSEWIVDINEVKERKDEPGVVLVDSRDRERYLGEIEPIDPIAGHIPGAINLPWKQITDDTGLILSTEDQQQRWANYQDASEIIVYCGSGVTACVNLLSLEVAGIDRGKLYVGSWSDWCSYL